MILLLVLLPFDINACDQPIHFSPKINPIISEGY